MENVCIPMHLDAFALSPDCCDGNSKIAPYTQPNYTALRLDSHLIQHDVLDHVDFHNTFPATKNARLADLGQKPPNNLKRNRMGIHLHWSLPRFYRAAIANTKENAATPDHPEPVNPKFPLIPNRFMITRHIRKLQASNPLPEFQSWIVESNAVRFITDIGQEVDLESDVAPFVSYDGKPDNPDVLNSQTEVFLGQKFDLVGWGEAKARNHTQLTLMNSSNPLFPDYALHNTNVLSVIDNFSFRKDSNSPLQYVDQPQPCDYFVIGWHNDPKDDPLNAAVDADFSSRLKQLLLQLSEGSTKEFGIKQGTTRCLVYGAIYNVKYDFTKQPTSLADNGAKNFTDDVKMEPLAVGTTPLDSILTFLDAHSEDAGKIFEMDKDKGKNLAEDITGMAQFLYATADSYDARVQAQDLINRQSFAKGEGGLRWTSALRPLPGGKPAVPTKEDIELLTTLNDLQTKLDASKRKLRSLQWDLFAEWWKYVSEFIRDQNKLDRLAHYQPIVTNLVNAIGKDSNFGLQSTINKLQAKIDKLNDPMKVKSSVKDFYYTRSDPTLCIAGLGSGRPQDFISPLTITLDHELKSDTSSVDLIFTGGTNPVPTDHDLQATARKLLAECLKNADTQNGITDPPLTTGFQAWGDRNPFVPLFIEWESIYYHIDKEDWEVQLRSSPWGHNHSIVRYAPKRILASAPDPTAKPSPPDFRSLSGRVLVLPQPVFSLENIVLSIIDNPPKGLKADPDVNDLIHKNIRKLKFISAPLAGITSHLLTRCEGAHVKPLVRVQGDKVRALDIAAKASQAIGIDSTVLPLIDGESALTPYGTLMAFGTDDYPKDKSPFKGVTHGQMLFTKISIVDKFGQAIVLPSTRSRLRKATHPPHSKIYPCLSEFLAPDVVGNTVNTVYSSPPAIDGQVPLCEYIQLTPGINQDTRINAAFLIRDMRKDGTYGAWREAAEFDQPIFGWIIINYADGGLQFFLADGSFYREIRRGGVNGATVSPKWLPNKPPSSLPTDAGTKQLDQLIEQLSPDKDENSTFLQSFFDMINGSIVNMPFPPSEYSGYANAIVGKPLALVNAGWSLEQAAPAIKPQNTFGNTSANPQADLEAYGFPIKIGDIERTYDGVVGYWLSANDGGGPFDSSSKTDWSTLHTYFVKKPHSKLADIRLPGKGVFPELHPYYIDPDATGDHNINDAHTSKFIVTTLLIDPYTPIHAFSPILPTKTLTLPAWTVQRAFENMHAFFHLGPVLQTADVPRALADAESIDPATNLKRFIKLPVSGRKGTWSWFQPYATTDPAALEPEYAQMDVQEDVGAGVGGRFATEPAPYTFLEGFLQLMGSLQGAGPAPPPAPASAPPAGG